MKLICEVPFYVAEVFFFCAVKNMCNIKKHTWIDCSSAVFQASGATAALCACLFPDAACGMSEDELMFSEDEDVEAFSFGQTPQPQPQPKIHAADKLLRLNRLVSH